MKATVLAFALLSATACGGATSISSSSPANEEPSPGSSSSTTPTVPKDPVTNHPASTISFAPSKVEARRDPVHAGCKEKNAPFTDDDLFVLQPVRTPPDNKKITSIAITFQRTVKLGSPVDLVIGGPTRGATFGDGKLQAHAIDEDVGPTITVFHPGFATGDGYESPLVKARVTILAVATKDGDPLAARVELTFADGDVLDATYVGSLKSSDGACGRDG